MRWTSLLLAAVLMVPILPAEHVDVKKITWACGGRGSHPDHCGIDAIGGEGFRTAGEPQWDTRSWIADEERVLGVDIEDDARAVPVRLLDVHEIANVDIGGVPVAITYCPLCGSGVTFDRRLAIDGLTTTMDLTASGYLFQNDMVMWDPQTETLWNQILGTPIATLDGGPKSAHHDLRLERIPTILTTWKAWKADHPGSLMLQKAYAGSDYRVGYGEGSDYQRNGDIGIHGRRGDIDGIHPKEPVIGVDEGAPVAFSLLAVVRDGGVAFHEATGIVVAARQDGWHVTYDAAGRAFTATDSGLWEDQEGHLWDLVRGQRADGSQSLSPIDSTRMYWFAWHEHHPETAVWAPSAGEAGLLEDNGRLPGFTIGFVAVLLLGLAVWWRRG